MKRILFSLLFLSLTISGFSQESANDAVYEFNDFSGGLNTKLSSLSLPVKQGIICNDLRFDSELGSLSKRGQILNYGTASATDAILGMHRLYLKDSTKVLLVNHGSTISKGSDSTGTFTSILTIGTGNHRWQWVTWNNVAIGTDGYNQPVKYDGTSASATYLGTCLATVSDTAGNPSGTYTYKVTFYTASYEVAFNVASNSVSPSSKKVTLSMIPIGPDSYGGESVTGRKVYRVEAGVWKLLSNGTIADNSTTTLLDNDTTASGAVYPSTYVATPPKGKLLIIHKNRLFLANDPNNPSRLFYSDDSNPDYFVSTSYYFDIRPDDGDQITFIKQWLGILTVGKENTIQKMYTDGATPATDWEVSDPYSFLGCKSMYSAKETPIGIIYLRTDGLYKFSGQSSSLISESVTSEINDISESNLPNCWGEFHKNVYYLSYTSKSSGSSTNDKILVFDLLSNAYSIDTFGVNCFTIFNSGSDWDVLYSGGSNSGKVYIHANPSYEIKHSKHSDFTGTFTNSRYIPVSVGGDSDNPVIEISRTATIDSLTGNINSMTGTIDRDSFTGNYISQALEVSASSYDKIYWNEDLGSGGNITFAIRSSATEDGLTLASWSSEYTNPDGSDISGLTANTYVQYRTSLTTGSYTYSPELYKSNNYVIKLTYLKEGSTGETTIPFHWKSGWLDLGYPHAKKTLKKVICYHEGTSGTLTLKFTNYEGDSDTFNINLSTYPTQYSEYFTTGKFLGQMFNLDISNSDLNSLVIKKIILVFDVEPFV